MSLRAHIVELIGRQRFPLSDEKRLQEAMAQVLVDDGLYIRREYGLGDGDIVDFLVLSDTILPLRGVAIEVKIRGGKRAIYRQLERYCRHEAVQSIILATNVMMGLPAEIEGCDTSVVNLGRGWL